VAGCGVGVFDVPHIQTGDTQKATDQTDCRPPRNVVESP
jgi:hypothetical protein